MPPPRRSRRTEPPVSPDEAAEALDYWIGRLKRLPHRRRHARREARAMIARWERRHREAVIAERSRRLLGRLVLELGLEFLLAPPRAPGGPLARRRRQRAHEALQQLEQRELRERLGKR